MHKVLLSFIFIFCYCFAFAQDTIHFINGEIVAAKVLNISEESILFKKQENLDGPDYTIKLNKVEKIVFKNGVVETYNAPKNQDVKKPVSAPRKVVYSKGNILKRGNCVYVITEGKSAYENAGAMELEKQIRRTGIWKIVNSPDAAHFILEYVVNTNGPDQAYVLIRTTLGSAKTENRGTSEEINENKKVSKKIFEKDLLPLVKALDKGKTPSIIKSFIVK